MSTAKRKKPGPKKKRARHMRPEDFQISNLLKTGRKIWGQDRLNLTGILVRLGKGFGDMCLIARESPGHNVAPYHIEDLKKEMGNVIFSMIRWCNDLGLDPEECVRLAIHAQSKYAANRTKPR
jgi:hypothetical protein